MIKSKLNSYCDEQECARSSPVIKSEICNIQKIENFGSGRRGIIIFRYSGIYKWKQN